VAWPWVSLLSLQRVRWRLTCECTSRLAHRGRSRCKAVVSKGGDGDGEGGRRRKVVLLLFGYKLCLYLVMSCVWCLCLVMSSG
jgi:hypothetical protein